MKLFVAVHCATPNPFYSEVVGIFNSMAAAKKAVEKETKDADDTESWKWEKQNGGRHFYYNSDDDGDAYLVKCVNAPEPPKKKVCEWKGINIGNKGVVYETSCGQDIELDSKEYGYGEYPKKCTHCKKTLEYVEGQS